MPPRSPIAWSWRNVGFGAVVAAPAAITAVFDPASGVPLAVGVLPAAALGLRSTRGERVMVALVGAVAAVSLLLGSIVAPQPVLAVVMVFALCVAVAALASDPRRRLAPVMLMLGLPLYGAGLSEGNWTTGLAAALLIAAGSLYAWLISLLWPQGESRERPERPAVPRRAMVVYGVQIGLAGAAGAALGFALGVDHPGWACTAALLVSRPVRDQLDTRAWGRSASVLLGSVVACGIAALALPDPAIAAVVLATLAAASGTTGSRWYIFPFFSTVIVLSMLLLDETQTPVHWLIERVGLTLAGVALALLAAWLVPAVARRLPSAR
jgi:uncharacterized membrane protein YccC